MKRFYIAYGSNLNVRQMRMRCPDAVIIGTAFIPDYRLLFKGSKSGNYLTIEPHSGSRVPVAVWAVSARDERNLDRYEGFPDFYYKKGFSLDVKQSESRKIRKLTAFAYIMHEERKLGMPSSLYLQTCGTGYRDFGFDLQYLLDAMDASRKVVQ